MKIGIWNAAESRFLRAQWLPDPNSAVFLAAPAAVTPLPIEAVGRFPGTSYTARISNVSALVTHNTAILGILGIGKTMLSLELVERMIAEGIKVICLDLTNQYEAQLAEFFDPVSLNQEREQFNQVGENGSGNVQLNVEEGGSINEFQANYFASNYIRSSPRTTLGLSESTIRQASRFGGRTVDLTKAMHLWPVYAD